MNGIYLCPKCGRMMPTSLFACCHAKMKSKDDSWKWGIKCINEECDGEMFECDEEMIIPIEILNQKGYTTRFCCSGHLNEKTCRGYIAFANGVELNSVPRGWFIDARDEAMLNHSVIRYQFTENDLLKRRHKIHRKINALIRWAEDLESRKEE